MARPGEVLADRFELVELASTGGMASVWRAHDRHTGETVALKLMDGNERGNDRFVREAQALSRLVHPGVVRYVGHGTSRGTAWLAMEWLDGEDLAARLEREPVTTGESIELCRRVAAALSDAHRAGVVHRDLKPSNLFLVDGRIDRVRILDFGVARLRGATFAVTRAGVVIGTPGYLAPEQARGDAEIDARADVFALGCILFECLTGRRAFEGTRPLALLAKVLLARVPRVREIRPEVPSVLDELVARMTAFASGDRPADATAVLGVLDRVEARHSVLPAPVRSERPLSLGGTEQQLLCVVIAGGETVADVRTLAPEELADLRGRLPELARRHSAELEALVDGSVVLTMRGTGSATDQAARAARAALDLRGALDGRAIALATGRGVVSGRLPVGEVIERAAALLDGARGSEVRIDAVTAGLLDARFEVTGGPEARVLAAAREVSLAPRTLLGRPTPCVGRDKELGILEAVADACFDDPAAQAVLLTGVAGVGKSRIRDELIRRLRERDETVQVWIGRGDPMRAGSPFGLVSQALRTAFGLLEGLPVEVRRSILRAAVDRHVEPDDAERVAAFLGQLLGIDAASDDLLLAARADPILMGDQMQRAWEDLLLGVCRHHPLVLVIEDLQWGDLPSVRFVDRALRSLSDCPLLVVAVGRPDLHEVFPSLWRGRDVQEVRVAELGRRASLRLVHEALGNGIAAEVAERLVDRAAGNAFFLEELIRAHAEGEDASAPDTVLAILQTRLEAMEPEARRVLRAASVFGSVFWRGGVVALLGGEREAEEVDDWLAVLVAREVIGVRSASRFPNDTEYVFRHALVRDAAYGMLTRGDRELGHGLAAEWLARSGERDSVHLAEHLDQSADPGRAGPLWTRAAEEALEGNDLGAALAHASRAEERGVTEEVLGRVRLAQTEVWRWRGDNEQAMRAGLEAMALLPSGSPAWCRAAAELAGAIGRRGDREALERLAEQAVSAIPDGPVSEDLVTALARIAIYHYYVGIPEPAARVRARLESEPVVWAPLAQAWLHVLRANEALFRGDLGAYLAEVRAARDRFVDAGFARRALTEAVNVGYALLELGAHEGAFETLRAAADEADRLGLTDSALMAKHNLGRVLARLGRVGEARRVERETAEAFAERGDVRMEGGSRVYLAQILLQGGDVSGAAREAERAVKLLADVHTLAPYALATLAQALLARDDVEAALEASTRGREIAKSIGGVAEEGDALVRLVHARSLARSGRSAEAADVLTEARKRLSERADRIGDPELRASFLGNVPENAQTLTSSV